MAITITATNVTAGSSDILASQYNSVVTDLNTIATALDTGGVGVPVGAIIPWYAPSDSFALPTGFQVCDGSKIESGIYAGYDTPNLVNKFLMGTTHSAIGTISGGSNTHNLAHSHAVDIAHSHPAHKHTTSAVSLTVDQMPSHTHTQNAHNHTFNGWDLLQYVGSGGNVAVASGITFRGVTPTNAQATATNQNTGGGQTHTHGDTGNVTDSLATTNKTSTSTLSVSYDIRPAYIGVVFLIRVI